MADGVQRIMGGVVNTLFKFQVFKTILVAEKGFFKQTSKFVLIKLIYFINIFDHLFKTIVPQ